MIFFLDDPDTIGGICENDEIIICFSFFPFLPVSLSFEVRCLRILSVSTSRHGSIDDSKLNW